MEPVSFLTLAELCLVALVAGVIDSIAGGGGLLTLPSLMAAGVNPVAAIATNKLQGIFSPLSAMIHFSRNGKVRLRDHTLPALTAFLGGVGGAASVSIADPHFVKMLAPFLLIGIALWLLFTPKLGNVPRKARLSFTACALTLIPAISFYDGFIGPGTGTFFALGAVALLGLKLDDATVRAKIYNSASSLGALVLFIFFTNNIVWIYGLVMIVGTAIGGNLGARLILLHGANLVKPVLVATSFAMSVKLLWQQGVIQNIVGFVKL